MPTLQVGDLIDINVEHRTKTVQQASHSEFPSPPAQPVDASIITGIRKSSKITAGPWSLLTHLRPYDASGEFVYTDGTIIASESVNPQSIASGKLSPQKLEQMKTAIAACRFEKVQTASTAPDPGLNREIGGSCWEYMMDPNCKKIEISASSSLSAPPADLKVITRNAGEKAALELLSVLNSYHKTIKSEAPKRLFYEKVYGSGDYGPPYFQVCGKDGKYHTEGCKLSGIAREFPAIGVNLSQGGANGIPISNKTFLAHQDVLNNTYLRVTNTYFRQGDKIYGGLELDFSPLPQTNL